ncbi:MAG: LysM peptidoglycan-binding domain-containing protein [Oscillospiraceae bacterium]|nr:LysM peptidoglycan-binding domain-containing protein [Oscillospiraceae bacterium]
MELPFEKTETRFWQQKLYTPVVKEETQEYKLPDTLPDAGRVISAWGQAVLRGKEWRGDHISLSGGVMVWILYAPEDGSEPRRVESWLPFSMRVEHHHDGEDGVIRTECMLCSVDARNVSARKLMLRCSVGLMVQTLVPRAAELYHPKEMPEDIQLLDRTYPMVLTRETGERTFLVEELLPMDRQIPRKLIYYRLTPRVTEQKVLGSRAVFRGVGELHLLGLDEQQKLVSLDLQVPLAQYLELQEDWGEGSEVSNLLCVTSLEVEPEENGIRVKCGLVSQYILNVPGVIRCLEDAYSPQRELELVRQEVVLPAWLDEQVQLFELQERLTGDEVPVDAIFFPELPMVTKQPGGAEIRVGGSFQLLSEAPDGLLLGRQLKTARTVSQRTECDTIPCTWLRGGTGLRRDGGSWTAEQELEMRIDSIAARPIAMVSSMKAGECRVPDPERPSVIVRSGCPGETLWDIAKYCGSTVSAIQRLNKLESEPEEGRLLLIPVV